MAQLEAFLHPPKARTFRLVCNLPHQLDEGQLVEAAHRVLAQQLTDQASAAVPHPPRRNGGWGENSAGYSPPDVASGPVRAGQGHLPRSRSSSCPRQKVPFEGSYSSQARTSPARRRTESRPNPHGEHHHISPDAWRSGWPACSTGCRSPAAARASGRCRPVQHRHETVVMVLGALRPGRSGLRARRELHGLR